MGTTLASGITANNGRPQNMRSGEGCAPRLESFNPQEPLEAWFDERNRFHEVSLIRYLESRVCLLDEDATPGAWPAAF